MSDEKKSETKSDDKPVRLMNGIRVVASEINQSCECHEDEPKTVVVVILEDDEAGAAILLNEDEATTLLEQIKTAREYAVKANFARSGSPGACA